MILMKIMSCSSSSSSSYDYGYLFVCEEATDEASPLWCSSSSNLGSFWSFNIYIFPNSKTVEWKSVSRLCEKKTLLTVNGEYPGPTIAVQEDDDVEIKVTNHISLNTTIHWHGIKQRRSGWADGPAYITQCPIKSGESYTFRFKVIGQRGTLWWHAHISWQRASVHGEWWKEDVEGIEADTILYGSGPNTSDAYTINGLPGSLHPCSNKDTFIQNVERGKTYMLRIINAALNNELFFAISNHTLPVVEIGAIYTKPLTTPAIMIASGQTTNVLLTTDQNPGTFVMAARPYVTAIVPFDNTTTVGFLHYKEEDTIKMPQKISISNLPPMRDTSFATKFSNSLKSLASTC
ncbi:Multicopper oxidase [Macleaya cordata]|uniref:laccase n=1 Tax=Macleaya cordata TaxID=56857 RepID=A0A200PU91_MACCD|nr:Multicopper oxidase [Macleaya cordata]